MKIVAYRIDTGTGEPIDYLLASPRKAIEANFPNPDEISLIWKASNAGSMYRVKWTDCGTIATFIGYMYIIEEDEE